MIVTRPRPLVSALALVIAMALPGCITPPPVPDMRQAVRSPGAAASGPVPFQLDDNRVFVPVTLIGADGRERRTLAFVNMGFAGLALSNKLYRDLGVGDGRALRMRIGMTEISIDPETVQPESEVLDFQLHFLPTRGPAGPAEQGAYAARKAQGPGGLMQAMVGPLPVGAVLPAGLLALSRVTLDYGALTLSLDPAGGPAPAGIAVPLRVNPATGFAVVDAIVGDERRTLVIDDGSSFSSLRRDLAWATARRHSDWLRSKGGIGEANLSLSAADVGAPVLRTPQLRIGGLSMASFDVSGFGAPGLVGLVANPAFWRYYSAKAGEHVDGWIGGNVLKSFRLTVDYPNRISYWQQEAPLDLGELDQVGLVLVRDGSTVTVAGIARKRSQPTVTGVLPQDRLVAVDGHVVAGSTRGQLLGLLHGRPGEAHLLSLNRGGAAIKLTAPVTAF